MELLEFCSRVGGRAIVSALLPAARGSMERLPEARRVGGGAGGRWEVVTG